MSHQQFHDTLGVSGEDTTILPRRRTHAGRARLLPLGVVAVLGLTVAACGDDEADGPATATESEAATAADQATARPAFGLVTPAQAAELAADSDVVVLDVRTPQEFAEGHIDGATMVDFEAPTFADEVGRLDPTANYLVYCRSGNRSGQAVAVMQQLGFEHIWDLDGGVISWTADGRPLVQ